MAALVGVAALAGAARTRGGCALRGPKDRLHTPTEERAGQQLYSYNVTPPLSPALPTHCLRCWVLPDACLEVLPVPNSTLVYANPRSNSQGVGLYPASQRPFRLHVAGLSEAALAARLERLGAYIKDPLFSQILRHIERDVVRQRSPRVHLRRMTNPTASANPRCRFALQRCRCGACGRSGRSVCSNQSDL